MAANAGDSDSIPGSGRSPEEGNGNPRQGSYRINPKDRGAWQAKSRGSQKSWTQLSDQTAITQPDWWPYEGKRLGPRETPGIQARRKGHVGMQQGAAIYRPRREAQETRPTGTLTVDFQNRQEIQFCCLNHPDCGLLLWQP